MRLQSVPQFILWLVHDKSPNLQYIMRSGSVWVNILWETKAWAWRKCPVFLLLGEPESCLIFHFLHGEVVSCDSMLLSSGRFETVCWVWCLNWKWKEYYVNWIFFGFSKSRIRAAELDILDQRMPDGNVALLYSCPHGQLTSGRGPWLICTRCLWLKTVSERPGRPGWNIASAGSRVASVSVTWRGVLLDLTSQRDVAMAEL